MKVKVILDHPVFNRCVKEWQNKGTSAVSIRNNYELVIKRFFLWLIRVYREFQETTINTIPVWKIQKLHLNEYKVFLVREVWQGNRSEISAKRDIQYLKGYFSLCFQLRLIRTDITEGVSNINADEYIPRELPSKRQLTQFFFDVINSYSAESSKEALAFMLMLHIGFRCSEVAALKWDGVNMSNRTISFMRKGGNWVVKPMPAAVYQAFMTYGIDEKGYCFCSDQKKFNDELYQIYKVYAKIAGWNFPGGVHIFRHKFLTNVSKFATPRQLQLLADHKSLQTTAKYLHFSQETLKNAVDHIDY